MTDDDGKLIPIVKTERYSLDDYIPNCTKYKNWLYSKSTKTYAVQRFYNEIDNEIKEKISSLTRATNESVIDDDMVFLFLPRQVLRQPVAVFAYNVF